MPSRFELGIHPLTPRLVAMQLVLLAATLPLYPILGLTVVWRSALPVLAAVPCLLLGWTYYVRTKTTAFERRIAETLLIFALLLALAAMAGPGQYAAAALNRPTIDPWQIGRAHV